ncbi:DNA-binding response regulator [Microtetraspora sp. NBRC 13810]|uniref:response regulator n=1 Tax=Microtetraspora sp. NBRC 13810 TaxID=3030990 RepID=UPI00249FB82C|nr:response regulator transcription factor [Microtetraspora sp. NBRC 13810]GLW12415.1 DNA-binding response regulator [Microtetraspora sp. NBRC 13810]
MSDKTTFASRVAPQRGWKPGPVLRKRDHIRILIADEHKLMREVLREVLLAEEDFRVVDDSYALESLVDLVARVRPDVVLFDIDKPHMTPIDVVRSLRQVSPDTVVAVLSMYDDIELIKSMLRAGVRCYLHKGIGRQDLVSALRGVVDAEGKVTLAVPRETFVNTDTGYSVPLSEREQEVLALVAAAMSNRQIAGRLSVTEGTVKRHLRNIFHKLGAVSRIDAVNKYNAIASSRGVGCLRPPLKRLRN